MAALVLVELQDGVATVTLNRPEVYNAFDWPLIDGLACALARFAVDSRVLAVVLTGADEALALGLATRVVEDDAVTAAAVEMARDLAQRSVHAFGRNKRLLLESLGSSFEAQLERERESIAACGVHPDGQEGLTAFAGKRKPRFNVQ